jgi:light-regulated signal transduction histidine kinase (bacteriophytochrome)
VSHDLLAPLLAFDGLSKTMLEEYGDRLDKRAKDNLKRMRGASQRMTSVFEALQTLFRLTSGEVHREKLDVTALAREVVKEIKAGATERDVKVEVAPAMTASGDRRLVGILLSNLLSNALKFTSVKSSALIEVGTERVDGESRIYVRDNGVGFDMIYAHRLFGAFQRLHSQSEFPGAGIGLATARRIVNRHGGRIWAEGAVGEGATFYFVI